MNMLQDSKGKHKNGRNIDYTATTEVKQQSSALLRPDLFLALLRNYQDLLALKNVDQPSNLALS